MNKVIFEFDGTIDKFIGDAVMVLFGAPQDMSPEQQVERATRCALAMNDALDRLAMRWTDERAMALKMRIGIHHGPAVVGNFGSSQRSDYTAIGPTVNFAARIESAAEAGAVYVSKRCSACSTPTDGSPRAALTSRVSKVLRSQTGFIVLVEALGTRPLVDALDSLYTSACETPRIEETWIKAACRKMLSQSLEVASLGL